MARLQLHALGQACGIAADYRASDGSQRSVSDATREALLGAMGIDASSERAAGAALREQNEERRARCLDAIDVVPAERTWKLRVRPPRHWRGRFAAWSLMLVAEDGACRQVEGSARVGSGRGRGLGIACPPLDAGIHEARLRLECASETALATQAIFAVPPACPDVEQQLGQPRSYGLWAHVYALAGPRDFGIGDLGHLGTLVERAAAEGAAFVGTQPFHALGNTWQCTSPYSPVSRLFLNPIYLDLEVVPELRASEEGRTALRSLEAFGRLEALRTASQIDYEAVMYAKRFALERLFGAFRSAHAAGATPRGRAYRVYLEREGAALQVYALYCALADRFGGTYSPATDWRQWPARFRDPSSPEVREFAREQSARVEFHVWLQFETDRQLGALGARARAVLPLGLMGDLALGSGRGSADTWMHRELFVAGASLGAPPDAFADGQDWDLPPLHPLRSRTDGHAYWRRVLRRAIDGMGALRVDHVMGLFRQFWIPAGRPPAEGAYVEVPSRELLGLLAIESQRARAVVVGEDLGTRPAALGPRLARAGILSTRVLPFERTRSGGFRAADRYGARAYVTAHTHDLPPLLGWCSGRDLDLRHATGGLEEPALGAARAERRRDVAALKRRLLLDGWLSEEEAGRVEGDAGGARFAAAATAFLASTPAPLLALSVDDLVGEHDPLNLPAIPLQHDPDRPNRAGGANWANWARRMTIGSNALLDHPVARALLAAVPAARRIPKRA